MQNEKLRGFVKFGTVFHGQNQSQAYGDCPFCGKEGKFYVNLKNLLWDCKVCSLKGDYLRFLSEMADQCFKALDPVSKKKLATNRGLPLEAISEWRIGRYGNQYTIPIYSEAGKIQDLRTYELGKKIMSSPGCSVGLFGIEKLIKSDTFLPVYLCEGEWDGVALHWLLKVLKKKAIVVAVPGAGTFKREWIDALKGREVIVLYDNDGAGENGELTVKARLMGNAKSLRYIHWPANLPEGFDIRDLIVREAIEKKRPRATLEKITTLLESHPRKKDLTELASGEIANLSSENDVDLKITIEDVFKVFKKWMYIKNTDGIEMALATVISNQMQGDPVWLFLVAPPGGSKTEIMNTFSRVSTTYTTSSLTPQALVSGALMRNGSDPSLIPKLDGKTLIIKDFTSIMGKKENEKDEIFGILRDAYDGKCGKVFGNGVERYYESHFSVLSGVTPSIYELSGQYAGLGERFLKFFIGHNLEHDHEVDIIDRAISNVNTEKEMRDEMAEVVLRYVNKICFLMKQKDFKSPVIPPEIRHSLIRLAQWGAGMRGVIGREKYRDDMITSRPSTEVGSRIGKQLAKILIALATGRETKQCTEDNFRLVRKCMLDTISQRDEDIFRMLFKSCTTIDDSLTTLDVAVRTRYPMTTIRRVLDNMNLLNVVTRCGSANKLSWTISKKMRDLIKESRLYTIEEELNRPQVMTRRSIRFAKKGEKNGNT